MSSDEPVVNVRQGGVHLGAQGRQRGGLRVEAGLVGAARLGQDAGDALLVQEPAQRDLHRLGAAGDEFAAQARELTGRLGGHVVGDDGEDPAGVE